MFDGNILSYYEEAAEQCFDAYCLSFFKQTVAYFLTPSFFSRPINDLDDVRTAMSSLKDIREAEIRIDMTIGPVEESYALLNRFELYYDDGNSERVDMLAYQWRNLMAQVRYCFIFGGVEVTILFFKVNQVQNTLLEVQPGFKASLLSGVEKFQNDVGYFYKDYDTKCVIMC